MLTTAVRGFHFHVFDFNTAFLNANRPEDVDVYVEQPHGRSVVHPRLRQKRRTTVEATQRVTRRREISTAVTAIEEAGDVEMED